MEDMRDALKASNLGHLPKGKVKTLRRRKEAAYNSAHKTGSKEPKTRPARELTGRVVVPPRAVDLRRKARL
jgi:hypothetical protein